MTTRWQLVVNTFFVKNIEFEEVRIKKLAQRIDFGMVSLPWI